MGLSPRVGRVDLPATAPQKGVDVDCSARFDALRDAGKVGGGAQASHIFYFSDLRFMADLGATLIGRVDRTVLPTRERCAGDGPCAFRLRPD